MALQVWKNPTLIWGDDADGVGVGGQSPLMDTIFRVHAKDCQAFGGGGDWNSVLIIPELVGHGLNANPEGWARWKHPPQHAPKIAPGLSDRMLVKKQKTKRTLMVGKRAAAAVRHLCSAILSGGPNRTVYLTALTNMWQRLQVSVG